MNAKLLIGIAVIGLAIALVFVSSLVTQPNEDTAKNTPQNIAKLNLEIDSISIASINDRGATFEIKFNAVNTNSETVLLQYVKYTIRADNQRVHVGLIGERPVGFVTSSNFITMIQDASVKISDKFSIRNTGSNSELWESILSAEPIWSVDAEASYNYSSFVAGGENLDTFEFRNIPTLITPQG